MRFSFSVFVALVFLFTSCKESCEINQAIHSSPPVHLIEAKGYTFSQDSIKEPEVVYIGTPNIIKAGAPKVTPVNLNYGEAGGISIMENFTTDNGLALDGISFGQNSAICDTKGNLWFATVGGGVSRYDGKSFTNFTIIQGLANNFVTTILEDRSGNIWFGTNGGGISKYDGRSFTTFSTKQGLIHDLVFSITEDHDGKLWIGTYVGISKYDGKTFTNISTDHVVRAILQDKLGNFWIGTYGGGINKYDGKSFVNFSIKNGLADSVVSSIVEDKKGHLWIGTEGGGLSKYDGKCFTNFTTDQGLSNNSVFCITQDRSGNLWLGTRGGGVSRFNGKSFTNFSTAQGLTNNIVWGITQDKNGDIWFGTYGGGICKYDCEYISCFRSAHGLENNNVFGIAEDKAGNLWFGTSGGGVSKYDGKSFSNYSINQGLPNNMVWVIDEDKSGNLWFGTNGGGICKYDGKTFQHFTTKQGLLNNEIKFTLETTNGDFWIATSDGVSKYNGKSFTNYTVKQGLPNNIVLSMLEDQGIIWFATNDGLSKYDGKVFTNFTSRDGLPNNFICALAKDSCGNLWLGTVGGGLSRYDGKSFINFTTGQGLSDNTVTQIIFDSEQNIFIGTNNGLSVLTCFKIKYLYDVTDSVSAINNLDNQELINYVPGFKNYNSRNGYPIKDVNGGKNSLYKDSKGIIWIGTGSDKTALMRFDYHSLIKNRNVNVPTVFIQSVKIDEEDVGWYGLNCDKYDSVTVAQQEAMAFGKLLSPQARDSMKVKFGSIKFDSISKFYPTPVNPIIPYGRNQIGFEYAAIETGRPSLVEYQYILEGNCNAWSPVTDKTYIGYNNLYEGTYTFKLKAKGPNGVWSEPIEYTFTILPPWWRTWWMYALYGILVITLIALIVWINGWRLRKKAKELTIQIRKATQEIKIQQEALQEQQIRELELIAIRAQMNPHFLFNILASIQMLINKNDILSANNALAKFGKLMRLILENSEKQTIFLCDEIEMLKLYVELESLLISFNCIISVDPSLDVENIPIPTMIIQPYVENAIKHGLSGLSSNRELIIDFQKRKSGLFCSIRDNGIGRKMSEATKSKYSEHKSMGTRLAQDRLQIMNKQVSANVEVSIKDLVDERGLAAGTLVELNLPFSYYEN